MKVFYYTHSTPTVVSLQVNGPEALMVALVNHYGTRYDPWGRAKEHVVFHIV